VTKQLPRDEKNPRTKQLSPFPGDFIDSKPVVRSFVLQLLLKYDLHYIEPHLQQFMDEQEPMVEAQSQFPDLCIMIVQCLEDSIMTDKKTSSNGRTDPMKLAMKHMAARLEANFHPDARLVRSLMNTAQDRLAVNTVGEAVHAFLSGASEKDSVIGLLKTATDFVLLHPQSANVKKYLVRYMAAKYQQSAVVEWKRKGFFLDLLPEELRDIQCSDIPDVFLIIDTNYKTIRDALTQAWLNGNYEGLSKLVVRHRDNRKLWTLALHRITKINPCVLRDEAAFNKFLSDQDWLRDIWTKKDESYQSLVSIL
jgi:hypothetical protein